MPTASPEDQDWGPSVHPAKPNSVNSPKTKSLQKDPPLVGGSQLTKPLQQDTLLTIYSRPHGMATNAEYLLMLLSVSQCSLVMQ